MKFKIYQCETLTALETFLTRARAQGPEEAFRYLTSEQPYRGLEGLPGAPYACLRLPTGGGKTILAAKAVQLVGDAYLGRARHVTLWMVPSDAIKSQVIEALNDTSHPYRRMLDHAFAGEVRIFDIGNFTEIRPHDLATKACIIVTTIQSFRVKDTTSRAVYKHHEMLEPHFSGAFDATGLERISEDEVTEENGLTAGVVKFSFANLMHRERPIMIVDEAHNAVSELSEEMQRRLNPSAIIEFTATPKGRNNILHSVTAAALKAEEMIKLPIILKTAPDWRSAVSMAVAKRMALHEAGKRDKDRIRPLVLYQAQPGKGDASPEAIKDYLHKEKLVPEDRIVIATGTERGLDDIDIKDPTCKIEHIITIEALKEGWDCPNAYILCATQRMSSATKIEQLLGRVLRMPGAERRSQAALNQAYAFVSDPNVLEVAATLRDKLVSMGFTNEEVSDNLRTGTVERDRKTGRLVARDDAALALFEHSFAPEAATPEKLEAVVASGGEIFVEADTGMVTVAAAELVQDDLFDTLVEMAPAAEHPVLIEKRAVQTNAYEQMKSPAERGIVISVPGLECDLGGECISAHDDSAFEVDPLKLDAGTATLGVEEFVVADNGSVIVLDLDQGRGGAEKLVWTNISASAPLFPELEKLRATDELAYVVRLLERRCKRPNIPQEDLSTWLNALVSFLQDERKLDAEEMLRLEGPLVSAISAKLRSMERAARRASFERVFFTSNAELQPMPGRFIFDKQTYEGMNLDAPAGGLVLAKHLLGGRQIPRLDGKPFGEEMQCAAALDALDQVEVWVRNVVRHPKSFCLMRPEGERYYPDFVARLTDGRIFLVEYKGASGTDRDETRDKARVADLWARQTGNVYAVIEKIKHGQDMRTQMLAAIS